MAKKPRKNPFDPDYAPYGHAAARGSPSDWKAAYEYRMLGEEEALNVLDKDNPSVVLGIAPGADAATIKKAYRHIVTTECKDAFSINPDAKAVERFKKVHAAYSFLTGKS